MKSEERKKNISPLQGGDGEGVDGIAKGYVCNNKTIIVGRESSSKGMEYEQRWQHLEIPENECRSG